MKTVFAVLSFIMQMMSTRREKILMRGISHGEQVEGTKETFVINHAPAESISVEERS